jgi:hypothetical protein
MPWLPKRSQSLTATLASIWANSPASRILRRFQSRPVRSTRSPALRWRAGRKMAGRKPVSRPEESV